MYHANPLPRRETGAGRGRSLRCPRGRGRASARPEARRPPCAERPPAGAAPRVSARCVSGAVSPRRETDLRAHQYSFLVKQQFTPPRATRITGTCEAALSAPSPVRLGIGRLYLGRSGLALVMRLRLGLGAPVPRYCPTTTPTTHRCRCRSRAYRSRAARAARALPAPPR